MSSTNFVKLMELRNEYLKEEVYIEKPKWLEQLGKKEHMYILKKTLYGLNQAPRAWYARWLDKYLLQ
jgi:hypothetical protein